MKEREWKTEKPTVVSPFKHSLNWDQQHLLSRTHDDDVGHALEGGLFDLGDIVVMDAQLLQALGHVGGHVLECVPGQVETLQLGERAKGLVVNGADLVVHKDQSLCGRDRKKSFDCHTCLFFPTSGDEAAHYWSLKCEHYGFYTLFETHSRGNNAVPYSIPAYAQLIFSGISALLFGIWSPSHTSYSTVGSALAVRRVFIGKVGESESLKLIGE